MPKHLASWNPSRDVWETPPDLLSEQSDVYSVTLPVSGMTRSGELFELPPLAHPTAANASSSLPTLPTPDAYAGNRGGSQHPQKRRAGGHSVTLADVTEHL